MKNNIILFGVFSSVLILWFQESKKNDTKQKKLIKNTLDCLKLPVLVTCLVLLALECDSSNLGFGKSKTIEIVTSQPNF